MWFGISLCFFIEIWVRVFEILRGPESLPVWHTQQGRKCLSGAGGWAMLLEPHTWPLHQASAWCGISFVADVREAPWKRLGVCEPLKKYQNLLVGQWTERKDRWKERQERSSQCSGSAQALRQEHQEAQDKLPLSRCLKSSHFFQVSLPLLACYF